MPLAEMFIPYFRSISTTSSFFMEYVHDVAAEKEGRMSIIISSYNGSKVASTIAGVECG